MSVETERGSTVRGSTVAVEHGVHTGAYVAGTSWGAIWAGFFVALAVEFVLSILMVGVFASMVHPTGGSPSGKSFGFGIAAWIFVQTLIAYYCGGYVAGRVRPGTQSALTGAAVWGITTVVLVYLLVAVAGSAMSGIIEVIRAAFGIAAATTQVPGAGAGPVAGQIGAQAGAAAQAAGGVAVAIATWVPIYFFFTLLLSLGTAVWGARANRVQV